MKYALIGCGRIAVNHVKAVAANDLEFVAMCDIDSSKFDIMLKKADCGNFPETKRYSDYQVMLDENPDIELVAIATESGSHAKIALDCIDKGKNLIIEKPIAMSIADADEIINRAKKKTSRYLPVIKIVLMLPSKKQEKLLSRVVLGRCPMVQSMYGGIATSPTMSRLPGVVPGQKMVDA